jgi:alkylation response protein AidB-like acyl-CoA dehydrogenase
MPEGFFQDAPRLANTYAADVVLRDALARLLPADVHASLEPGWQALGEAAAGPLEELARQAEASPPRHVPFDAWGRRVDDVVVDPAWRRLQDEAARFGLAAAAYDRTLGPWGRLHQLALLMLYGPSSAVFTCHLAMTDGAARTLIEHGGPALAERAVPHLTSRDPAELWTSGQWMTERSGGSDVSGTRTVAREREGVWRLTGDKWFTSAITSEMALTLARADGAPAGSAGLSLFYLEQRRPDGARNGVVIHRLKDKLGTRALPTAEISLLDTVAVPVGGLGQGVKKVAPLLNITRLHNAVSACGMMARLLQLLRDYARRRQAFGGPLAAKPLHRETVADLAVEYEAGLGLTLECARLRGRQEAGEADDADQAGLRLLTPLAKLFTAKQAVAVASEALEGFGGAGYIEDTGLPVWLRDAQVLPIWEGTTNVLSLDLLRAVAKEGLLEAWAGRARDRLDAAAGGGLAPVAATLRAALDEAVATLPRSLAAGPPFVEAGARRLALRLAAVAAGLVLVEQAAWAGPQGRGPRSALAARRFVSERLPRLLDPEDARAHLDASALLSGLGDDASSEVPD